MARDIWAETEEEVTGEYKPTSSGFEPIPEGTRVKATLEEIKYDSFGGSDHQHINIKWAVDEPEEYNKRKFFQGIYINGTDPESQYYDESKQDKNISDAMRMFFAIDKNAGGFIAAQKRKPTDAELKQYLIGAQMMVVLGINKSNKQVVRGISAAEGAPTPKAKAATVKPISKPAATATGDNGFSVSDDDIPF